MKTPLSKLWHLVKRLIGSVTATPLRPDEQRDVAAILTASEGHLFSRLAMVDQRHALHVLRRFVSFAPGAPQTAQRAALLHDIGKGDCSLGTFMRVVATVVGPRTKTFRRYHDHEALGRAMLLQAGSDPLTIALLRGDGEVSLVTALRRADAI